MTNEHFERRYRTIAFWALAGLTLVASAVVVAPFLGAILWATVLSVLMYPLYGRLRRRFSENLSATFSVLATLGLIVLPLSVIGLMLYVQLSGFAGSFDVASAGERQPPIEQVVKSIDAAIQPVLQNVGSDFSVSRWFDANREEVAKQVTGPIGRAAFGAVTSVVTFVIALLTMFFMLRDGHRLLDPALDIIPLPAEKSLQILTKMRDTMRAVFVGVVLVAIIQGTIAGLLYKFTDVPSPVMWALVTTVLCVIPLLGAPVVYIPMTLMLLSQGEYVKAGVLAGGGFLVISQIDNLLRPFFIGARSNLHPMGVFFSLLGGVLALGPVGLMAGPVLLTVLLALLDVVRESRRLAEAGS